MIPNFQLSADGLLIQALVLSKLYFNCVGYHNVPHYLVKNLERIQTFVVGKVLESEDIL